MIVDFKKLCLLKELIDNLNHKKKELLYINCIKNLNMEKTINTTGVYFNLRILNNENYEHILKYINEILIPSYEV